MSLTVKAYVLREQETNEIRRFSVDQDVSTNHTYLREKIAHIFPILQNKRFSLYWKDTDNEYISFSSDEEQTEALGFVTDGIFKVYIKEEGSNPTPEEGPGVFHPHVFCDECEGPVYGIRYKCTVCPDYDLCSKCKAKDLHSEHSMTAISQPRFGGWMGFGCHAGHPPHHRPPHHGGPHHGFPPYGPPFRGACPFGLRGKTPFGPWGRGRCYRAGARMCHEMMRDFWQTANQNDAENKEGQQTDDHPQEGTETGNHSKENKEFQSGNEEYLKTVGESVAAMLDPLGISVEVDVDHGGVRQRCHGEGTHCTWTSWEGPVHCECRDSTCTCKSAEEKSSGMEMESDETGTADKESDQDIETGEAATASKAEKEESSPDRDWTIIDDGSNGTDHAKSNSSRVADMDVEANKKTPDAANVSEEQINRALDHMTAMGFADEGGWLTTLLKVTGGDINKALDAIRANRSK